MSSKIVGWLVGDWDGKKSDKKNLNKKKLSELNLKRRNPVFLPESESQIGVLLLLSLAVGYSSCFSA